MTVPLPLRPDARWPAAELAVETHFDGRTLLCYRPRPANLGAMIRAATTDRLDQAALVDGPHTLSWGELHAQSARLAHGLHQQGLRPGDRAVLLMGNHAGFVVALLALLRLGAVAVPVSVREAVPGIAYILDQCQASAVLADAPRMDLLAQTDVALRPGLRVCLGPADEAASLRSIWPGWLSGQTLLSLPPWNEHAEPGEEAPAVILYTSGTTGRPKGAVLTHLNLVHSVLHYRHALGLNPQDRALLAVPASHVTGLVAIVLAMAGVGGCTVMLREFKAATCLDLLQSQRISYSLMVPAMYALCLREPALAHTDLSCWRLAGFGGAPMPPATIATLRAQCPGIRLFNAYGATETTSPTTLTPPGSDRVDQVGIALPCAQVRVVDEAGHDVPVGQSGEVWIAGPMVVPAYWDNPEATAAGFQDGFWKSGDIGTLDAQGFLQVHDRKKDMINRGGYKVFSVEVENCLMAHPEVQEAATVGVPCPVLGERTHAFVWLSPEAKREDLQARLRDWCRSRLADYKVPDHWTWLDQPLPRNANGKVIKTTLRQQALLAQGTTA